MIGFTTASGSEYELDVNAKKVRRISGKAPQPRVSDGDWRPYVEISPIFIASRVAILWDTETTTVTSPVTRSWVRS